MRQKALYLGIILLIVVVIVVIATGFDSEKETDTEMGASAAAALTEARIEGLTTSMQVMALTDEVKSADWATMEPLLAEFEDDSIPLVAWFALPNGSYYTVDIGGLATGNLSYREYFPVVMGGDIAKGYILTSLSTNRSSTVVAVPVVDGNDVIGALGASIYLEELSRSIVNDLKLSDDMILYAVDGNGNIALHSDVAMIMENASEQADPCDANSEISTVLGWTFYLGYK
jgi:hypothetical protein